MVKTPVAGVEVSPARSTSWYCFAQLAPVDLLGYDKQSQKFLVLGISSATFSCRKSVSETVLFIIKKTQQKVKDGM